MASIIQNHAIISRDQLARRQLVDITTSLAETRQEIIALSSFFPSEFQQRNLLSEEGLVDAGRRLRNLQAFLWEYIERLNDFRENYLEKDVMQRLP